MLVESTCIVGGLSAMTGAYQGYYDAVYAKKRNFFLQNTNLVNLETSHGILGECFNGAVLAGSIYYDVDTNIKLSNPITALPTIVALNVKPVFYWVGVLASNARYHCIREKFFNTTTPAERPHAIKGSKYGLLPHYMPSQVDVQCYGNYPVNADQNQKIETLKDIVAHRRAISYGYQSLSTTFAVTDTNEDNNESSHRIGINESSYGKVITLDIKILTKWSPINYALAATFKKFYDYDTSDNQKLIPDPLKNYLKSKIESGYAIKIVNNGRSLPSFLQEKPDGHNKLIDVLEVDQKYSDKVKTVDRAPQADKPKTYKLGGGVKVTLAQDHTTHRAHFESMTWFENISSVLGFGYKSAHAQELYKEIDSHAISITGSNHRVADAIRDFAFGVDQGNCSGNNKVVSIYDISKSNPVFSENEGKLFNATLHKVSYDNKRDKGSYLYAYISDIGAFIGESLKKSFDSSSSPIMRVLKTAASLVVNTVNTVWNTLFMMITLPFALRSYTEEVFLDDLVNSIVQNQKLEKSSPYSNAHRCAAVTEKLAVRGNDVKVSFSAVNEGESIFSEPLLFNVKSKGKGVNKDRTRAALFEEKTPSAIAVA